ncbi:hypothetical protein ACS0TY_029046 [Phlomoides rotata]
MTELVHLSDEDCKNNLRMDRAAFHRLCQLLYDLGGLRNSRYVNVQEKVAVFLSILAHHTKNRSLKYQFKRSGQTISKHFHSVLRSVLKLHYLLLTEPQPVPDDSTDPRWGSFKGKAPRSRRSWSKIEEDAVIQCLVEIVNSGWKADNGFKAGFQRELEKGMKKLLTGTDLVANPHINSKIHVWKKEYGALSDLLSKSGIGWNDFTHAIDVTNEDVWEACKKADPQVKTMCYKSWPYYGQWLDIFGKDRATGEHAIDPIDIVNDLVRNKEPITSEPVEGQAENTVPCDKSEVEEKTVKGKKRKAVDSEMGAFVETIGELIKSNDQTFNSLAERIGPDQEAKIARKSLNEILRGIPGLSLQEKLKVVFPIRVMTLNFTKTNFNRITLKQRLSSIEIVLSPQTHKVRVSLISHVYMAMLSLICQTLTRTTISLPLVYFSTPLTISSMLNPMDFVRL